MAHSRGRDLGCVICSHSREGIRDSDPGDVASLYLPRIADPDYAGDGGPYGVLVIEKTVYMERALFIQNA